MGAKKDEGLFPLAVSVARGEIKLATLPEGSRRRVTDLVKAYGTETLRAWPAGGRAPVRMSSQPETRPGRVKAW